MPETNVHNLTNRDPDADAAIADRVRRVFGKELRYSLLGDYLLRGIGWEDCASEAMHDAWTIGHVISALDTKSDELPDRVVPELGFLQTRLLDVAHAVHRADIDTQSEGRSHE